MPDYTTPRTWVGGEFVTAAILNTELRDNIIAFLANTANLLEGVFLRTAPGAADAKTQVKLLEATAITMNDGVRVSSGWSNLTADMSVSGAGGLDTSTEVASTWYEVYAIRKSSDGTCNLLLHRAPSYDAGSSMTTAVDGGLALRDAAARTAIAQGIQITTGSSGSVPGYVELQLANTGTPTGQIYCEIHTDSGGVPSGTAIATSDKLNVFKILTGAYLPLRMPFHGATTTMNTSTQYHLVVKSDATISGVNYTNIGTKSANPYASGATSIFDGTTWTASGTTDFNFRFGALTTYGTGSPTMPSGYDQYRKIGYVYNDSSSDFTPFIAHGRIVQPLVNMALSASITTNWHTVYVGAFLPAIPVRVGAIINTESGSANFVRMGGVPDGYTYGVYRSEGNSDIRGIVTSAEGNVYTETQAMYFGNPGAGDTSSAYLSWWEWLK